MLICCFSFFCSSAFGRSRLSLYCIFFFNDTATTEIYTLSLHDALPICTTSPSRLCDCRMHSRFAHDHKLRSEEHTSELQSLRHLVCRLLLEKKKNDMI